MKKLLMILGICYSMILNNALAEVNIDQVFKKAHQYITLADSMTFNVAVLSNNHKFTYKVFIHNKLHSIIKFLSPATEQDKKVLVKGQKMWIYIPNINRVVCIATEQKLVGVVSNIDLARTGLDVDYYPVYITQTILNEQQVYLLKLRANVKEARYSQADLYVNLDTYQPLQVDYFNNSGTLVKQTIFADYQLILGNLISLKRIIRDKISNQEAILNYSNFKVQESVDEFFNPSYLPLF